MILLRQLHTEPKINQLDFKLLVNQHILHLDIPMHYVLGMAI